VSVPQTAKKRVLITAGPTREKIDPVRFISNYSTGVFGYAIAEEARRRGLDTILISGPVSLKPPGGVRLIRVESALEMRRVLSREFPASDLLIMAAAVSDWRAGSIAGRKLKKSGSYMTLKLVRNPDILKELGRRKGRRVIAGFALETGRLAANAFNKLSDKNIDIIIGNKAGHGAEAFGDKKTSIILIDRLGNRREVTNKTKKELAKIILDKVLNFGIIGNSTYYRKNR